MIPDIFIQWRKKLILDYRRRSGVLAEKGLFFYLRGSNGYILIIVLLVISLLVSVSGEFLVTAQTNVSYVRKFGEKMKADTVARAGVLLATAVLEVDRRGISTGLLRGVSTDPNTDSYRDIWAVDFPEIPVEGGVLKIKIDDENSKINISVLANEVVDRTPYYSVTQRFFLNLGVSMDIADALIDWVDIDDSRFPYGAESADYYMTLPRPYGAKNMEMDSVQEMLLVKGITPELYYGLEPVRAQEGTLVEDNRGASPIDASRLLEEYTQGGEVAMEPAGTRDERRSIGKERSRAFKDYFRVHGERSDYLNNLNKININTAPYRVLSALSDGMTDDIVTEIIRRRQEQPFASVDAASDLITDEPTRKNLCTVRSSIFRVEAAGRVRNTVSTIVAVYNRDNKKFYYFAEQ